MGLKEGGLRGSLRNIGAGGVTIPDSVVDNYELDPDGVYAGSDTVADYYSGDTSEYTITGTSPLEGSRSLETIAPAVSDLVSYPGDGLNNYASQGDVILVRYWAEDFAASDPPIDGLLFGVDSTVDEFYFLQFDGNKEILNLRKFPDDTSVGQTPVSWQSQETYTVKVDWNNNVSTDITVELYDSSDSLVADFTGTESEYSHQGIGLRSYVFGTAEQTRRYDLLEAGDLSGGAATDGETITATSGDASSIHTALANATEGDTVEVPSGDYNLKDTLVIDEDNVTLSLDADATIIRDASFTSMVTNANSGTISSFSESPNGFVVEGGVWDCNVSTYSGGVVGSFTYATDLVVRDTTMRDAGIHMLEINGCSAPEIRNVEFDTLDSTRGLISDSYGTEMIQVEPSNHLFAGATTSDGQRSEFLTVDNCTFSNSPGDDIVGVGDHGVDAPDGYDFTIKNCTFSNLEAGVHPYQWDTVLIENNLFESSVGEAITDAGTNVTTSGNTIQ